MKSEFIVPVGDVIREYLEEYDLNQKDLAIRLGMSEKHVSNFLNAKSRLTEEVAIKLEKIMPEIPADYWLNYESKYREYIARQKEMQILSENDLNIISTVFHFNTIFNKNDWDTRREADEMLKKLQISSFEQFEPTYRDMFPDNHFQGQNLVDIVLWNKMCEKRLTNQNNQLASKIYKKELNEAEQRIAERKIPDIDYIVGDDILIETNHAFNQAGMYFSYYKFFENKEIKLGGIVTQYKKKPALYINSDLSQQKFSEVTLRGIHEVRYRKEIKSPIMIEA